MLQYQNDTGITLSPCRSEASHCTRKRIEKVAFPIKPIPKTPAQLTLGVFYNNRQHLAWGQRLGPRIVFWGRLCVLRVRRHRDGDARHTNTPARFYWHVLLG